MSPAESPTPAVPPVVPPAPPPAANTDPCRHTVAVRALAEFTAKAGDLDVRFTPAPTALQGQEGHQAVAARRGADYQTEISLSGQHGALRVRGRADGFDPTLQRLEEIKTHRGSLERQPDNHRALHWAQLQLYGWLWCEQHGLQGEATLTLALVYFDIGSRQETVLTRSCRADALQQHFQACCEAYLGWAAQETAHRQARDAALATLPFPHGSFRGGQRALAEAVFKVARAGRLLLTQAPTGIGKTMGTLFPLLRACPGGAHANPDAPGLDRIFFLTAKTSGRALALDAVRVLRAAQSNLLPLRVLELVAREKACEHPDKTCHGDSCPLAAGFYDRLAGARQAAMGEPLLDRAAVQRVALAHQICPYYLGQELARWCDVVVGDYNHFFDLSAMLHTLTVLQDWRVGLLLDEAHNLVDRARLMYTATLDPARWQRLRRQLPKALKTLKTLHSALNKLQKAWKTVRLNLPTTTAAMEADTPPVLYHVLPEPPQELVQALQQASTAVLDHLSEHPTTVHAPELQEFLFEALHWQRLAETFGPHSLCDLSLSPDLRAAELCLRNVVPAPFLALRWAAVQTATLFSATLEPTHYHRDLLGLPAETAWLDVDSPFEATQLAVHLVPQISTRWAHRRASLAPIAHCIAQQYRAQPGNYLAFFSSFEYLEQVASTLQTLYPDIPCWQQSRRMREAEQAAFLARFVCGGQGIGFAVLGGAFAEGVDLPGERLIGAFIATLGLPQISPVNEQMRQRLGFDYTYLYPGLQKVVQAAGRVIRTPQDRGVVYLIDDRFGQPQVQALLPRWWGRPQRFTLINENRTLSPHTPNSLSSSSNI